MDSLELLSEYIETAKDIFAIETQMTGAVLVRNLPVTSVARLEEGVRDEIKMENVKALRIFASKNITSANDAYTVEMQSAESGNYANARFQLKYTGPRLKHKISGIHSTKEDASKFLRGVVQKTVARIRLEDLNEQKKVGAANKVTDISMASRYLKLVARHTSHEMVFKVVPNKKQYGEMVRMFMPKMLERMVITENTYDEKSGQSTWKINAAGMPWLVRIAKYLDKEIANAV